MFGEEGALILFSTTFNVVLISILSLSSISPHFFPYFPFLPLFLYNNNNNMQEILIWSDNQTAYAKNQNLFERMRYIKVGGTNISSDPGQMIRLRDLIIITRSDLTKIRGLGLIFWSGLDN